MRFVGLLLCVLMLPMAAHAQMDEGLYDPLPPAGSAFIRFVNAAPNTETASVSIDKKTFAPLGFRAASPYYVAPKGPATLRLGQDDKALDVQEGQFYTVVLLDEIFIVKDTPNIDRTKSQIQLYNFSPHDALALKTADGKIKITDPAAKRETAIRPINAVKLETKLFADEQAVGESSTINLKRGMVHSAFVFAPDDNIHWVTNTTDTTQ